MSDSHTVVTSQSWFGRIAKSIGGVFFGIILVLIAVALLFWNEGRAVKTYKTLQEGAGVVVTVSADEVVPGNESKLVHMSGAAVTDSVPADEDFGIAENAIRLRRSVEMYQWEEKQQSETRKKLGGGEETVTTYTYTRGWNAGVVDSSAFNNPSGHENPRELPYESRTWDAEDVRVGAFTLSADLVSMLGDFEDLAVREIPTGAVWPGGASVDKGKIFLGADPAAPRVGDVRIAYSMVRPGDVSILAAQSGDSFEPYLTKAGGTIEMIAGGRLSAEGMFAAAHSQNTFLTWLLRVIGFVMMWAGLGLLLAPLSVLADVVPFLGNLVGAVTGFVTFLLALALSALVIAIAWIVLRPLLAVVLLVVSAAALVLGFKALRKKPVAA